MEALTLVPGSADHAVESRICISSGLSQQVAAVGTEDQGTDNRHLDNEKDNAESLSIKEYLAEKSSELVNVKVDRRW